MALSIKNSETERLARQVARETGESLTEAIEGALKERLQRLKQRQRGRITTEKLNDILRRVDNLPTLDTRSEDEILRDTTSREYPAMVVDTSALLAIFLAEPERNHFLDVITQSDKRYVSAANVLETGIVLEARRGEAAGREFDLFLHHAKLEVMPVDSDQIEIARIAWRKYGKGRHAAGLNFGDCFAYALAKVMGVPILYKGDDFARTDLSPAVS